jgi:hypothetical protein
MENCSKCKRKADFLSYYIDGNKVCTWRYNKMIKQKRILRHLEKSKK